MRARAAQPPAADARVYVDAIRGDDKADGRTPSTAFKTLGTALKARPLWLGLARNARFAGSLLIRTPMTVEAYGDGEPPVVDAAMPLSPKLWRRKARDIWIFESAIAQPMAVLGNGRRIEPKQNLVEADGAGAWAWIDGHIHLRSDAAPGDRFGDLAALNRSCFAIDGADGVVIRGVVGVNGVHGFVGQRARNAEISSCRALACAKNGFYLADATSGWLLTDCVAEDNGGAGFAFNYGAATSAVRRSQGNRNGVDGCQFSESCGTGNSLTDCEFRQNAIAGVNCKEKRQRVERCRMIDNGEAGVIAQINTEILEIADSVIMGNNRADNGTMNLAIEDAAVVVSTRNIYAAVQGRKKEAANVRLIGRSGFQSVTDVFLDPASAGNVVASIRVATSGGPGLSLRHASFYNGATRIGRIIDCRGATNAPISISNTAISGSAICLAFDSGAKVESDHNCYFNSAGGPIIEIAGVRPRQVVPENFRGFANANSIERNSIAADPRFADPDRLNFSLAANSPARRAGAANAGLVDAFKVPFSSPANIGAIAENGDLSRRVRP